VKVIKVIVRRHPDHKKLFGTILDLEISIKQNIKYYQSYTFSAF